MAANIASNSLTRNERSMSATMERLSTGLRINSAKDDAAGLAISSKMTSQINGLKQAVRNSNDAISMVQVAEGAMKEVTNMFQRMRELAIQAISDSNTSNDRVALNNEYKQLSQEVQRIAENTQWNGTNILDGARTNTVFQVGANASQTIAVNFGDLGTNNITASTNGTSTITLSSGLLQADDVITYKVNDTHFGTITVASGDLDSSGVFEGDSTDSNKVTPVEKDADGADVTELVTAAVVSNSGKTITLTITGSSDKISDVSLSRGTHAPVAATDITTSKFANTALGVLDTAIKNVNDTRASLGASMSRLEFASDNLQNVAQNTSAARSRVLDADYASETTELARTQIIQQAGTAMLAQANQSQQAVLSLLNFS
jgi:flagellin